MSNDQLLLYGSVSSMAAALHSNKIHELFNDILDMISDITIQNEEEVPIPIRMNRNEYNDIIGIRNAIAKDCDQTCTICLEGIQRRQRISVTKCGHYFHSKCLKNWLIKSCSAPECPCCRMNLKPE
jgi:hypothetical protein